MEVLFAVVVVICLMQVGTSFSTVLFASPTLINRTLAEIYCKDEKGSLVILDNQKKWDYVLGHKNYREQNMSDVSFWIDMKFNDSFACNETGSWIYNGWGVWKEDSAEPNGCPNQYCVRVTNNHMRTTKCDRLIKALCETERTSYTTATAPNVTCDQCCMQTKQTGKLNQKDLEEIKHELQVLLMVNKTSLSSQRRKLISVYESRTSCIVMGGFACFILSAAVGVVVFPDCITLIRSVYKRRHSPHNV